MASHFIFASAWVSCQKVFPGKDLGSFPLIPTVHEDSADSEATYKHGWKQATPMEKVTEGF